MSETVIDLIRHGEPRGGRLFRGDGVDDPLSETGWQQLRAALGTACRWEQVVSSPLARCRVFALELAARHALPFAVEPDLREIGMGDWEGLTPADVAARDPAALAAMYQDPAGCRPPGGEPLAAFTARVVPAFERLVAAHTGRRLLLLSHAVVMRAIVGHLLRADTGCWYRLRIDYAGVVRVRCGSNAFSVECVNAPAIPKW